jgi:hypothetical protein
MILPDSWMRGATGAPVSAEPMLAATARALGPGCARPRRDHDAGRTQPTA